MINETYFSTLKYNLYEIINVSSNAPKNFIKNNLIKLIKTFHPDKNSNLEEDIYCHIILANQILLDDNLREKYDNFINIKSNNFIELKENFNKNMTNLFTSSDGNNIYNFNIIASELDKKHGYDLDLNNEIITDKFAKIKSNRHNNINIEKNIYQSNDDFNNKFIKNKLQNGKFSDQIIEYKDIPAELSTYINEDIYTNLEDVNKLYINNSVQNSKFTSLDKAFMLYPELDIDIDNNIEDKIKSYKNETTLNLLKQI